MDSISQLAAQLYNIRTFAVVARAQGMTRAAGQLHRASSALTRSVRELERALGFKLYERSSRGILLSPHGKLVLARAERIEHELEQAAGEICQTSPASAVAIDHMLFNGRKLDLVVQLHDTRKISAAAERLGMSQSGASMALARIEGALGLMLFRREANGLAPTEAANLLVARAKRVAGEFRRLRSDLASHDGRISGTVVIGTLPLGRIHILPRAIATLVERHADLCVVTHEDSLDNLVAELKTGDIDAILAVPRAGMAKQGLDVRPLFTDSLVVLSRRGHPLGGRARLTLEELRGARWILPGAISPARAIFESSFSDAGLTPPTPSVESIDPSIIRQLLIYSDMLAVTSRSLMFTEIESGQLRELKNVPFPGITREVGLILRQGAVLSPAAEELLAELYTRHTDDLAQSMMAEGG
jgi:LysR family transcriptional regulator, regulator for genes of the gallate degradation pathway